MRSGLAAGKLRRPPAPRATAAVALGIQGAPARARQESRDGHGSPRAGVAVLADLDLLRAETKRTVQPYPEGGNLPTSGIVEDARSMTGSKPLTEVSALRLVLSSSRNTCHLF